MNQRVHLIDGLRGFSLLGILIANMLIFQYGIHGKDQLENLQLTTWDLIAYIWTKIFVESSFLPIFIFVFGYSLIKLKERLERNGQKVKRHIIRRLILLVIAGILHATFIWEGDILLAYGLIGFFMVIFVNRKKKTILIWAILLFTLTSVMSFGEADDLEILDSYLEKEARVYSSGSYSEVLEFRNSGEMPFDLPDYYYLIIAFMMPIVLSPLFLFGMYTAKSNWFSNYNSKRKLYKNAALILGVLGILLKSTPFIFENQEFWTAGAYTIGSTCLAIGYIFGFAYAYTLMGDKFKLYFQQIGKLSMTNYIMQSIICTLIFYGYGLGYFGKLGVIPGIVLAFCIFTIQIIASHYYLKILSVGPLEKLMRMGTYLTWNGNPKNKINNQKKIA